MTGAACRHHDRSGMAVAWESVFVGKGAHSSPQQEPAS